MNTNIIREALNTALSQYMRDPIHDELLVEALAELDKAPKVLTEEHYSIIADRMVEEYRKYGDRLRPGHWAEIAARKVAGHLSDFGYIGTYDVPKVLDASEIKRIVETFAIENVSQHGTQLVGMSDRQKEVCSLVLYHVSKAGYLAPSAGLTVEEAHEITLQWVSEEDLEHGYTEEAAARHRARLTAALNAKRNATPAKS